MPAASDPDVAAVLRDASLAAMHRGYTADRYLEKLAAARAGDLRTACTRIPLYNRAAGKVIPGLVIRRGGLCE